VMPPPFLFFSFDAYLFDIDGTLLNSRDGVHYHAFHHALRTVFGITELIDNVPLHGNNDFGIIHAMAGRARIGDEEFLQKLPRCWDELRAEALRNRAAMRPEVCSGIPALLSELQQRSKLLGVVSGNLESIGWAKLEAGGLRGYLSFGAFSDSLPEACHPDREIARAAIFRHGAERARRLSAKGRQARICVVGDTPVDIAAARVAGLPIVAVATGVYTQQQLAACGPDLSLDCCARLLHHVIDDVSDVGSRAAG
jgi:phosphoglycolate phosphatase